MSLAARCPACGTVFRVVQDQLRVSEGWVRCGRCSEVFNAIENLVDVDSQLAPSRPRPPDGSDGDDAPSTLGPTSTFDDPPAPSLPERLAARIAQTPPPAVTPPPAAPPTPRAPPPPGPDLRAEPPERPAFVRQAERAARWQTPRMRLALGAAALASALLLAAQAVFAYRDLAAARWPALRAVLEPVCQVAGCRIEPPRAIEALAVDSSGLVRVNGSALYKLTVVLRNRAAMALAVPAIDLTLTDSQGGVIARRTLALADFGTTLDALPAMAELPLQATLGTPGRSVSGYTIEVFYP